MFHGWWFQERAKELERLRADADHRAEAAEKEAAGQREQVWPSSHHSVGGRSVHETGLLPWRTAGLLVVRGLNRQDCDSAPFTVEGGPAGKGCRGTRGVGASAGPIVQLLVVGEQCRLT